MSKRTPHKVLLFAVFLLSGCRSNDKELPVTLDVPHNMRTHCVGRYLIDLPENFRQEHQLSDGPGDATLYFGRDKNFKTVDVTVVAQYVSPEQFQRAVDARAALIAQGTNYESKGSMLVEQKQWTPTAVLLRYYSSPDIADSYSHEVHVLVRDVHVALRAESFDGVMEPVESRLRDLLPKVKRIDDPARAGDGVCLGPVAVVSQHDFEETKIRFVQPGGKQGGIRLAVDYTTFKQPENEPSLIARGESNLQGLAVKPDVIRKGPRRLAGMAGQEWLGEFKDGAVRQLSFYAETDSRASGQPQPKVHLEFHAGGQTGDGEQTSASLSAAEAEALWDTALNTLRKIPGS